ncbi:hypothetical protein NE865_12175 [Phthorimaea operculella]|nr:hypothetical protein NE865_12175 [Phthorimaea operculella]
MNPAHKEACAACFGTLDPSFFLECKGTECKSRFFCKECANVNKEDYKRVKTSWLCFQCFSKLPKNINSNTPCGAAGTINSKISSNDSANVNLKRGSGPTRRELDLDESSDSQPKKSTPNEDNIVSSDAKYNTLLQEIRLLRQDIGTWKKHVEDRLDNITSRLSNAEKSLKELQSQQKECILLKETVNQLNEQLNSQAQESLSNDVELLGLEEMNNENLYHLALVAAKKVGVELTETDIDSVHRAGPRKKKSSENQGRENGAAQSELVRPVILRFTRKAQREAFLNAAKSRRNLDSKEIAGAGPSRKVYVNERLTFANRNLFREARSLAEEAKFDYCWTRGGNIFLRRKTGTQAIRIRSTEDLSKLSQDGRTQR